MDSIKQSKYQNLKFFQKIDQFKDALEKDKLTPSEIEHLGGIVVGERNLDLIKLLIHEHGLKITNVFIAKYVKKISICMFNLLENEMGNSILEYMNDDALNNLFECAYSKKNKTLIERIIYSGYDINKMKDKLKIIGNTKNCEILKFVLDHGLKLDFINREHLLLLLRENKIKIIKILYEYGVNIDMLNKTKISDSFNENYQSLIDMNVDPKNIAYFYESFYNDLQTEIELDNI